MKNILVVDDTLSQSVFLNAVIDKLGHKCKCVNSGKSAIEELTINKNYDLILMDIEMPEMNGLETTIYIRNEMKITIPIYAQTAHEDTDFSKYGFTGSLRKPLSFQHLKEIIENENKRKNKTNFTY